MSKSEADLLATEELNRRIIEAMPAGLVHVSLDGTIQRANEEALRVLGLSFDEITQRYTRDFEPDTIWEDGSPCPISEYPVTRVLMTGQAQEPKTIGVRRSDGGVSWSIYTAVPVTDPHTGAATGAVVTILDITARRESEAARSALEARLVYAEGMAAIGTIATGVAHEVNNPLTFILANLETALEDHSAGNDELASSLRDALEGARRIERVVSELGSFAREDASPGPVSLGAVLDATLDLAQGELRRRAQVVRDYDASHQVLGGRTKLGQLFLNLVINAIQAIPAGDSGRHEIRVTVRRTDHGTAQTTLSDTGVGIPERLVGSIFDPFVTTKDKDVGTGMGLYICRTIVTELGGRLSVQSTEGEGTTFTVELPVVEVSPPIREPGEPAVVAPHTTGLRVLIVDDEPLVRRVLVAMCQPWEAVGAHGGNEALRRLKEGRFDVVLCDMMMPEMTGMALYRQLADIRPEVLDRFVFMTGAAFTAEARAFLDAVDRPVLHKPIRRDALLALLSSVAG